MPGDNPFNRSSQTKRTPPGSPVSQPSTSSTTTTMSTPHTPSASAPAESFPPLQDAKRKRQSSENTELPTMGHILTQLSNFISSDKNINAEKKRNINELFGQLIDINTEQVKRITELETELRINKQQPKQSSYATVASTPAQQDRLQQINTTLKRKTHTVFLSKPNVPGREVQNHVTKILNPVKDRIKIRTIRSTPRMMVLEADSEEDACRVINHEGLKTNGIEASLPKKRKPLMILYAVDSSYKEEDLVETIHQQNFEDIPKEDITNHLKVRFRTGPRDKSFVHFVVEVSPILRRRIINNNNKLYIGFMCVNVKDYLVVAKCNKCQDLGHVMKYCNSKDQICGHCAEPGHLKRDCQKSQSAAVCIPCKNRKKTCNDINDCQTHKLLLDRQILNTDYGQ